MLNFNLRGPKNSCYVSFEHLLFHSFHSGKMNITSLSHPSGKRWFPPWFVMTVSRFELDISVALSSSWPSLKHSYLIQGNKCGKIMKERHYLISTFRESMRWDDGCKLCTGPFNNPLSHRVNLQKKWALILSIIPCEQLKIWNKICLICICDA